MKVTHSTPERIVLQSRPWLIGGALILATLVVAWVALSLARAGDWAGAGMMGLGVLLTLGAFAAFVRREEVELDRTSGQAILRSRSLFGQRQQVLEMAIVTSAAVQTSRRGSGTPTRRPVLCLAEGGSVPLVSAYTSGAAARRAAQAINDWLGSPKA